MPDPKKFDNKADFMGACMHQTLKIEKKDRDEAIAQCIGIWESRNKSARRVVASFLDAMDKESIWINPRKTPRTTEHLHQRQKQVMSQPPGKKNEPFAQKGEMVKMILPDGKEEKRPYDPEKMKDMTVEPIK